MNRMARALLVVCLFALCMGSVHGQTVNWKYAELGLARIDPDQGSSENGGYVGASWQFIDWLHAFGEYGDFGPYRQWQLGAGWHGLLGKRADLFADGAFFDADFADGARIRVGARWMMFKRIEVNGNVAWADLSGETNESVAANAIWNFSRRFSFGGGLEWGDRVSTARALLRFNFGPRD